MVTLKDSRGQNSKTLPMVWFILIVTGIKFLLGSFQFTEALGFPHMTGVEFGAVITPVLAAWIGREYVVKSNP